MWPAPVCEPAYERQSEKQQKNNTSVGISDPDLNGFVDPCPDLESGFRNT